MTRSIYIYCDGGFGNRYNSLLSGLFLAKIADLSPVVVWPTNNWCGASYEELFENNCIVLNRELASFADEKCEFHHLMEEDHLNMRVQYLSPRNITNIQTILDYIKSSTKDVFYYVALIPSCITASDIKPHLLANPFCREISDKAASFLQKNNLSDFYGIQIRKTDFGIDGADENNLFNLISQRQEASFFVCSDDKDVERQFATLPNVCIYRKQAHVEKLTDGGWNEKTTDYSGRVYTCNVNRSAMSVKEAIVDLLILSRSKLVRTSNSTFLSAALIIQACQK